MSTFSDDEMKSMLRSWRPPVFRDDRRASDFYDPNEGRHLPRRRFRPVFAGVGVIIVALICLFARCSQAGTIKISVSGTLEHWFEKSYYDALLGYPLVSPTPFLMTMWIDESTLDSDPASDHGVYTDQGNVIQFEFGDLNGEHFSAEQMCGATVEVFSGRSGLYGFLFRSANSQHQDDNPYGVFRPVSAFWGFNLQPFSSSVASTDALSHLYTSRNSVWLTYNLHYYMNGLIGDTQTAVGAEADDDITPFQVEIIP